MTTIRSTNEIETATKNKFVVQSMDKDLLVSKWEKPACNNRLNRLTVAVCKNCILFYIIHVERTGFV